RLYFRGYDAVELSRTRSIAEVASLMWTGGNADCGLRNSECGLRNAEFDIPHWIPRAQAVLARAAARDPLAFDLRPGSVAQTGWRILMRLTSVAAGSQPVSTIDATLARAWRVGGAGVDLLRAALILCADHELNVSAFTARCVASAGSTPY